MAQFKQWALQYVLSEDESAQVEIAQKAARGILLTLRGLCAHFNQHLLNE